MPSATPWWQTAVLYQVYPRSFLDTDGDGTGDLGGLRARLPYLRWLGVDGVWLSPIFRSPMADFGYKRTVDLGEQPGAEGDPVEMFADRLYDRAGPKLKGVELAGFGYRWIRLRETPGLTSGHAGGAAGPHPIPAQGPPLLLGRASPDARDLVGLQGVLEAHTAHLALVTDALGRLGLGQRLAAAAQGKEEVRIAPETPGLSTPRLVVSRQSLLLHVCPPLLERQLSRVYPTTAGLMPFWGQQLRAES